MDLRLGTGDQGNHFSASKNTYQLGFFVVVVNIIDDTSTYG